MTNRQKRKSEGGGKTEGCVVWGKKRSEGRQKYAVSARVADLSCALCPVGFVASSLCTCCGFTLSVPMGDHLGSDDSDHLSCFTRPIRK